MGLIKDQFGNVAVDDSAINAIIAAIREPEILTALEFTAPGVQRLG